MAEEESGTGGGASTETSATTSPTTGGSTEAEGGTRTPAAQFHGKHLVLIGAIVGSIAIALIAVFMIYGKNIISLSSSNASHETISKQASSFYDFPDMLVNLNTTNAKGAFLKISLSFELEDQHDSAIIDKMKPGIIDQLQVFLRELSVEDLKGSSALIRIREETLVRVNSVISPAKIRDVLFREMLVQ